MGFSRPQQHRLIWPLTASQVESIDTMFETLFKSLKDLAGLGGYFKFLDRLASTFIGFQAGNVTGTGTNNTGLGYQVSKALTTGTDNTVVGNKALTAETSGNGNTAVGSRALLISKGADGNTAIGIDTLQGVTTGRNNVAVGVTAGFGISTGEENVAIGDSALYSTSSGSNNVSLGPNTLSFNGTGSNNIALGPFAGFWINDSNHLYVNNILQANGAGDQAYSLMYGTFSGVAGSLTGQSLVINGDVAVNGSLTATNLAGAAKIMARVILGT